MNKDILPIGSVIEINNGRKLIIVGYNFDNGSKLSYLCGSYPTFYLMDFIPFSKMNEFKEQYNNDANDLFIDVDSDYEIIFLGYKNNKYIDFKNKMIV